MGQPESKHQTMKWMVIAMLVCCAVPIGISLALGGGLGFLAGRSTQPSIDTPSTTQPPVVQSLNLLR